MPPPRPPGTALTFAKVSCGSAAVLPSARPCGSQRGKPGKNAPGMPVFSERAHSCPAQKPGCGSRLCRALRGWETSGSAAMEGSVRSPAGHQGRALPSLAPCQAPNAPTRSCTAPNSPHGGVLP